VGFAPVQQDRRNLGEKMKWNYRLVSSPLPQNLGGGFFLEVNEVYYDPSGEPKAKTSPGVTGGGSKEEVIELLELILRDIKEFEVLDASTFTEKKEIEFFGD
jgi:hypothetical protein